MYLIILVKEVLILWLKSSSSERKKSLMVMGRIRANGSLSTRIIILPSSRYLLAVYGFSVVKILGK